MYVVVVLLVVYCIISIVRWLFHVASHTGIHSDVFPASAVAGQRCEPVEYNVRAGRLSVA
jgi:hypothetical protein